MKYIVFILVLINLISCETLYDAIHKPDPEKKTSSVVKVVDNGELIKSPSKKNIEIKTLEKIGDKIEFKYGEPFELVINGFDPSYYRLDYYYNDALQKGSIEVKASNTRKPIELKNKCDRLTILGPDIPEIQYSGEKSPKEQIVITPIYSDNCEFVGYEIRYGTIERGCKGESSKILRKLKDCTGISPSPPPKDIWVKLLLGF